MFRCRFVCVPGWIRLLTAPPTRVSEHGSAHSHSLLTNCLPSFWGGITVYLGRNCCSISCQKKSCHSKYHWCQRQWSFVIQRLLLVTALWALSVAVSQSCWHNKQQVYNCLKGNLVDAKCWSSVSHCQCALILFHHFVAICYLFNTVSVTSTPWKMKSLSDTWHFVPYTLLFTSTICHTKSI